MALGTCTLFATHPSVMAQPEIGRSIDDMAVKGGRLYLGHGNYSGNTGPIDVAYIDLATGEPGVALPAAPTEELAVFRMVNGSLFAPWLDPTGWGGATNPVNGGMSTDDSGSWKHEHTFPAGHVYDYAEVGTRRYLAGAIAYGGAGLWCSESGGPWELVQTDVSDIGPTESERYYWVAVLNGKVYVQGKHNGGIYSGTMFKMKCFDGKVWTTVADGYISTVWAHQVEVFKGRIYHPSGSFDGRRNRPSGAPPFATDWYNDGTYLYALTDNGSVSRTLRGSTWESVGRMDLPLVPSEVPGEPGKPRRARSLAVSGGQVYVGTNTGDVYRASL